MVATKYSLYCPYCGAKSVDPKNSYECLECKREVGPAELRTCEEMEDMGKRGLCHNGGDLVAKQRKTRK
jgi:DNA-directed RNA polymerase subunit RPC12/RpoP